MTDGLIQLVISYQPAKKMPAIEIAGLCLPLKPQKEKCMLIFNYLLKNFSFQQLSLHVDRC
jgi:hypothetical protein